MFAGFRSKVSGDTRGGLVVAKTGLARIRRGGLVLAGLLSVALASAQTSGVDAAIQNFQSEGVRLVGLVSTGGLAVIASVTLMVLGWAMVRKIQGGK